MDEPYPVNASPDVDLTGGLQNGEEVLNVIGTPTGEVIVYEYDSANNLIGWHKELK